MPRSAMSASAPPAPTAASWLLVADQQQLRPRRLAAAVDRDQVRGGRGAGLVDHQQVPAAQPERLVVAAAAAGVEPGLPVEPAADVPGGDAFLGEHVGLPLPVGDPEHPRPVPDGARRRAASPAVASAGGRAGWPVSGQVSARVPTRNDLPVPAGALRTSTAAPEVRMPRSAVAWSALSSRPARANRATIASASSVVQAGAPRRTAAARSSLSPRTGRRWRTAASAA